MLGIDNILGAVRIAPVQADIKPVLVLTPVAQQLGLNDGQVVQATAEVRNNRIRLWLREFSFELPTGWILKDGDKPFLRASSTPGGWGFLIQPGPPSDTPSPAINTQLPKALGAMNPNANAVLNSTQQSLSPLLQDIQASFSRFQTLSLMPNTFTAYMQMLSPSFLQVFAKNSDVFQWLAKWNAQCQSMAQINPMNLKRLVLQQGVSSEKKLSQGTIVVDDTKTIFKKLLSMLDDLEASEEVDQAKRGIHSAITEIEASQVQAAQNLVRGDLSLYLLIPFRDADPVELHFQKPKKKKGQEEPPLTVDIHSRSQVLGEVWLNTTISQGHTVDLVMWAVRDEIAALAKSNTSELSYELSTSGLRLNSFKIFNSPRPSDTPVTPTQSLGLVVDTKA